MFLANTIVSKLSVIYKNKWKIKKQISNIINTYETI